MRTSDLFSVVSAAQVSLDDLVALVLSQETRLLARNPRLRAGHTPQWVEAGLQRQQELQHGTPLAVLDPHGRVRAYATADLWELSAHSLLHAFLTEKNGIARSLTLPDPAHPDASDIASALLSALSTHWQQAQSTGELIRWPSHDTDWLQPILVAHGFLEDSVCAFRPLDAPLLAPVASPVPIREARPADEEALVKLFEEELRVHERSLPFARVSPAAIGGFRKKLARLWHGGALEDGAPLVLVAEMNERVVGMAECTLLHVEPDSEPGFTPPGRYGCLDNVCVQDAARRQGIGTELTQAALAIFDAMSSLKGCLLWYSPGNELAAHFWPRFGFVPLWTTFQRLYKSSTRER
jgi:ribosomal protein S18 acetylase RimI-like enzyme